MQRENDVENGHLLNGRKTIFPDDVGIELNRLFGNPLSLGVSLVHPEQSELFAITVGPLKIVHQAPDSVPNDPHLVLGNG